MLVLRSGVALTSGGATTRLAVAPAAPDLAIASHGDSISRDMGWAGNYIYQLSSLILVNRAETARLAPRGINGISYDYRWPSEPYTATMIEDGSVADAAIVSGLTSWLIVFAGTNGMAIGLHSAATEYANFKTYIAARIAAGWVANMIVACTMLPRSGFPDGTRQTFNASIAGDDVGLGYRKARLDLNGHIGDAGDDADTTYFYDGTHPTTAGHAIIAQIIYDTMFP